MSYCSSLPHPAQKIHATSSHCYNMLPIRMKSTGKEPTIHVQGTQACSRAHIPELERLVNGSRDDEVACWTDRTSIHRTHMPTQGAPLLACLGIPELERLVIGSRDDEVACWTD